MPRKPDVPCARCNKLGYAGRGSRPAGEYTCRACRQMHPTPYLKLDRVKIVVPCAQCGEKFLRRGREHKLCSVLCANRAAGIARAFQPESSKTRRSQRCSAAPGLSYTARQNLLQRWKRQQLPCAYCPEPATTVDHVVPLIRGGTNFEGNLTPACRRCNSSKGPWLLTEWRTGRRCTPTAYILPSPPRVRKRKRKPEPEPLSPLLCFVCGKHFTPKAKNNRYCSSACQYEYNARSARERYRAKAGLPPTWGVPTLPHVYGLREAS